MTEILMPQLGESVTEGTITQWFKAIGDHVDEDEPLFEVSTDKVDSEVPSPASGVLTKIVVAEGETVDVGVLLAVLGSTADIEASSNSEGGSVAAEPAQDDDGETALDHEPEQPAPAQSEPVAVAPVLDDEHATASPSSSPAPVEHFGDPVAPSAPAPAADVSPTAADPTWLSSEQNSSLVVSPIVRRLIEDHNIDPSTIQGTGPGARVTRDDVLAHIDQAAQAPVTPAPTPPGAPSATPAPSVVAVPQTPALAVTPPPSAPLSPPTPAPSALIPPVDHRVPLSNIRKRTGEHMVMSLATAPHVITAIEVDYEAVERVRKPSREGFKAAEGFSLTYLPFISRAVVETLKEFPMMNASVSTDDLVLHSAINLSIAVDLNFEGLLAPVIASAERLGLRDIARSVNDLATRARSKKLSPDDLSGGTFTLSNSGSYGTLFVAPIINQPQVAIMSTDGIHRRPVVVQLPDGSESIAIHSVGTLTLSWDHRAFDGAYAAAFMRRVKEIIETHDWAAEL